jgi:hypothetical protein
MTATKFEHDIQVFFVDTLKEFKDGIHRDTINQQALMTLIAYLPDFKFEVLDTTFFIDDKSKKLELLEHFKNYLIEFEHYELVDNLKQIYDDILNDKVVKYY